MAMRIGLIIGAAYMLNYFLATAKVLMDQASRNCEIVRLGSIDDVYPVNVSREDFFFTQRTRRGRKDAKNLNCSLCLRVLLAPYVKLIYFLPAAEA